MSYCEDYPCCGHTPLDPCSGVVVLTSSEYQEAYYCDRCGGAHQGDCEDDFISDDEFNDEDTDEQVRKWVCQKCGETVYAEQGYSTSCECGAEYNAFGQRLRDNWRDNPSNYDDEISDMDGYEMEHSEDG